MSQISTASFCTSRLGATRMLSLSTLQTAKLETTKRQSSKGLSRGKFLSWGLVYVTLYYTHTLKPTKSLTSFRDLGNPDTWLLHFPFKSLKLPRSPNFSSKGRLTFCTWPCVSHSHFWVSKFLLFWCREFLTSRSLELRWANSPSLVLSPFWLDSWSTWPQPYLLSGF